MNDARNSDNLYWLLLRVAFQAKQGLIRLADTYGLTVAQLHSLAILDPGAGVPMNRLSSTLLCDASNVTGIVDRLLSAGYIVREENPEDRRVKMIALTKEGEKLRNRFFHELNDYQLPSFSELTPTQRDNLKETLLVILRPIS
ncbi:MAG TPA: MarR family transcriptional regulator [Candidatus Chromulinivoraceae bacterium]|nr:MarR family transcriptional regulator [Candidatus Chromulinivoraceae bacterium]